MKYIVVTPALEWGGGMTALEPPVIEADTVIVDAPNKREAVKAGVKALLSQKGDNYCKVQRRDQCNPYTKVRAEAL